MGFVNPLLPMISASGFFVASKAGLIAADGKRLSAYVHPITN
jgi:hypothetical protein